MTGTSQEEVEAEAVAMVFEEEVEVDMAINKIISTNKVISKTKVIIDKNVTRRESCAIGVTRWDTLR